MTSLLQGRSAAGPPPVSGAWLPGAPVGRRRFVELDKPLTLEAGGALPDLRIAYETWGTLASDASNAVLVLHALTGDTHISGPACPGHPTSGWWDGLVGDGRPLDPRDWFIVVPNVLGGCQGSTGPATPAADGLPWGSRFPFVTVRDQVAAEVALADALGIDRWACVLGGSAGGTRALEWAVEHPDRVATLLIAACGAAASADHIGWTAAELTAIRSDPGWRGGDYYHLPPGQGPHRGLGIARRIAMLTYRSAQELNTRFGREAQRGEHPWRAGRYAVQSYLDHHADQFVRRFDAGSYVALSQAMNSHDIGRDRGGIAAALSRITAATMIVGVDSDRLYPLDEQRQLADGIQDADLRLISSLCGHDAFLIETDQMSAVLSDLLTGSPRALMSPP